MAQPQTLPNYAKIVGDAFDMGARTSLEATIHVLGKKPWRNRRALRTTRGLLARFDALVLGR